MATSQIRSANFDPIHEGVKMPASKNNFDQEEFIRESYAIAEKKDFDGWRARFVDDGIFIDNSLGVTYTGSDLDYPVWQYGAAFEDMHRELYRIWIIDDTVVVRLGVCCTTR
jgi:hypothetical protein